MTAGARNLYIHIEDCHECYGPDAVLEAFREWLANHPADTDDDEEPFC